MFRNYPFTRHAAEPGRQLWQERSSFSRVVSDFVTARPWRERLGKGILCATCLAASTNAFKAQADTWPSAGQNTRNTRANDSEKIISPANVSRLAVKWAFTTSGDVSATPAVDDAGVYFPDWGGMLYALDRNTGAVIWAKPVSEYTGTADSFSRVGPALTDEALIIGTQLDSSGQGARVMSIDKGTGNLLWMTQVDDHPAAIITQSAVVHGGVAYVGVSSEEETLATDPSYPCCSFRGSMLALDVKSGKILWKTYLTPSVDKGFSGVAVWGSTPVVDERRHSIYISTGNNYTVPQAVLDCVSAGDQRGCILSVDGSPENYFDAVVALDLRDGTVKWATSVIPFDSWVIGCLFATTVNCQSPDGPDFDFGQGPALFKLKGHPGGGELLGAGQKSGIYWTFDPDTGATVWSTKVGPGSVTGGLQWGSATDGRRIYTSDANKFYEPVTFTVGPQAGRTVEGGYWSALDAATGEVLWQVAGNAPPAVHTHSTPTGAIAQTPGPVSEANGVVYAGALDAAGTMYALDAATGNILWSFASGGSVNSGAAIVDGVVYWGSGYARKGGVGNNKFYAFHVPAPGKLASPAPVLGRTGQTHSTAGG